MSRTISFIEMVARLAASGDKFDVDGDECPNGYEHDTGDSLDALDELIHKAREFAKWTAVPKGNFIEGAWSFRAGKTANGKRFYNVVQKGARTMAFSLRSRAEMQECSDGKTWRFSVFRDGGGTMDARATFAEAKARVLALLNMKEA